MSSVRSVRTAAGVVLVLPFMPVNVARGEGASPDAGSGSTESQQVSKKWTPERWSECEVFVAAAGSSVRIVKCAGVELRLMRAEVLKGERLVRAMLGPAGAEAKIEYLHVGAAPDTLCRAEEWGVWKARRGAS